LVDVGKALKANGYKFTAVTPATHARVFRRQAVTASDAEIYGWNRWFDGALQSGVRNQLDRAGLLEQAEGRWRSAVRFATLHDLLFAHSAYPTADQDSVFFGPDTYRFCSLISECVASFPLVRTAVDVGCGSGAGGIFLSSLLGHQLEVILSDVNDRALDFSGVNAAINNVPGITCLESDGLDAVDGDIDLVISNPPYLADSTHRIYRDGGGEFGIDLPIKIAVQSIDRLRRGGMLVLYAGTPIIDGVDLLKARLRPLLENATLTSIYSEIDPDVFGEELDAPAYRSADRIAVVAFVVTKS
jgi:SAM-dependent methyltransferase